MNLNYAIFRSEPIMTINDLAQIGSHNKREKKSYNSNPDIDIEKSKDNIELVPLTDKYVKGFYNLVKDYKKEHDERMKTEREDRKKTFKQMLDKSNNVVADELLFTATNKFFENMTKEDIKEWANTCMEFVYNDLGYKKEQVLHATVHLDEKTPHIHCVVVPLVKKLDKRTNTERFTISKKQYIKDKVHLSQLQDKYHERLVSKGYDLERGIKGSDRKNQKVKEFKKTTSYYENKVTIINKGLDNAMNEFEEKIIKLGFLINEIRSTDKKYIKYNSLPKNQIGYDIRSLTKEIKRDIFKQSKMKQLTKEIENAINKINDILIDIDKRNNISKVGFENILENKLIKEKIEAEDNYILNAIVNHALFNFSYYRKKINKDNFKLEDLIDEMAYQFYKKDFKELRNKKIYYTKKKLLIRTFKGKRYKSNIEYALDRLGYEQEQAAKKFYDMFNETNEYEI